MVRKLSFWVVVCLGAAALAQTGDDFSIVLEKGAVNNEVVVVAAWKVDGIQGWSWGICHNPAQATITPCVTKMPNSGASNVVCASPDLCANITCTEDIKTPGPNNEPVGFLSLNAYDGGITQGAVLDFAQSWSLSKTDRFEMLKVRYDLGAGVDCTQITVCATLGTPPVDVTFVVNGQSYPPATMTPVSIGPNCGGPTCPELAMRVAKVGEDKVGVVLDTGTDQAVSGFQFGLSHSNPDLVIDSVEPGQAFVDNSIAKTEGFWGVNAIGDTGVTVGVVVDLEPQGQNWLTLPACKRDQQIAVASYKCDSGASGTQTANVALSGTLGTPPVEIVVDIDGNSVSPTVSSAAVSISVTCGAAQANFKRGDVNQDGKFNVSDGVAIAKAVFNLGSKLPLINKCKDSADVDDNGSIQTADALYLLRYLFLSGPQPNAPFPACGSDTSPDTLTCEEYTCR